MRWSEPDAAQRIGRTAVVAAEERKTIKAARLRRNKRHLQRDRIHLRIAQEPREALEPMQQLMLGRRRAAGGRAWERFGEARQAQGALAQQRDDQPGEVDRLGGPQKRADRLDQREQPRVRCHRSLR